LIIKGIIYIFDKFLQTTTVLIATKRHIC